MRLRNCAALALIGAALGCGDDGSAPLDVELVIRSQTLVMNLRQVRVRLHPGLFECEVLEAAPPDFRPVYGTEITFDEGQAVGGGTVFGIVQDTYSVDAWGLDENGQPLGHGCSDDPVEVRRGELSDVSIELRELPGL